MFLIVDDGKMVNLNNVDVIDMDWDDRDGEGAVIYWKYYRINDTVPRACIGKVQFSDKDDFQNYIEKNLVPLQYNNAALHDSNTK